MSAEPVRTANGRRPFPDDPLISGPRREEPIRSHAHAAQVLSDEAFLAYARVEAEKLYKALVRKRWPEVT